MSNNAEWSGLDLLGLFKAYYSEVVRFKRMILRGHIDWAEFDALDVVITSEEDEAEAVSTHLRHLLQEQVDYVSQHARESELQIFKQAQYLMAALTDEIFLVELSNWSGQRFWFDLLLEKHFFGTSNAGEQLFISIDEIVAKEVLTLLEKELVKVYLLALRLGFSSPRTVGDREELFRKIGSRFDSREHLFPEAYQGVMKRADAQRMSSVSRWHRVMVGSLIFFLIASSAAWLYLTHPLETLI